MLSSAHKLSRKEPQKSLLAAVRQLDEHPGRIQEPGVMHQLAMNIVLDVPRCMMELVGVCSSLYEGLILDQHLSCFPPVNTSHSRATYPPFGSAIGSYRFRKDGSDYVLGVKFSGDEASYRSRLCNAQHQPENDPEQKK